MDHSRTTDTWAGGPNDKERKRNRLDGVLNAADFLLSDNPSYGKDTASRLVNEEARTRKYAARKGKFEYADPKSDAEAFAMPGWGAQLAHLRALGLPIQRVRSLIRGAAEGESYESLLVCDADEDGNVLPYDVRVMENRERMPDVVCDHRATRGEVPDRVAWCATPGTFAKVAVRRESTPIIKEGRFTGNFIGRAVAGKVNDLLDSKQWVTVYGPDRERAQALADKAIGANMYRGTVWMARGPLFVYAVPLQGGRLGVEQLVELQREYAPLLKR